MTDPLLSLVVTSGYLTYLLVPGYLMSCCLGIHCNRFLLSYSLGLGIITLSILVIYLLGESITIWMITHHIIVTLLAVTAWRSNRLRQSRLSKKSTWTGIPRPHVWGLLALLGLFATYHIIVGPYTEIPSDIWKHLARVGIELDSLRNGSFGPSPGASLNLSDVNPIYVIHALAAYFLGALPLNLVPAITLVTSSIFLATIYFFSLGILCQLRVSPKARIVGALGATALVFLTLGTASFSYIRYYAYFPTIFAFPLIFASAAIFLDYLQRPNNNGVQLLLLPVLLATMWVIHRQEALLTIILLSMIAFTRASRCYLSRHYFSAELKARARASAQFAALVIALILIYAFSARTMTSWEHTPHVIDTGQYFSLASGIPLDNPTFRFWDTLGFFGLGVYVWWLIHLRVLSRSDFLTAGMVLPLFTNLNPLYAVLFLHFGPATGMWRTAYLIPLGITAAAAIAVSFSLVSTKQVLFKNGSSYVLVLFLIAAIIPWNYQGNFNRTSRLPSLLAVDKNSGAKLWQDLIDQVENIQNRQSIRRIITDPVTKFVLYASTRGEIWPWGEDNYFPNHNTVYKSDFLESDFSHSLLVVNKRNGVRTNNALHAGHWPPDILAVSQFYPDNLQSFIDSHPELLQPLWERNDITIYIMRSALD